MNLPAIDCQHYVITMKNKSEWDNIGSDAEQTKVSSGLLLFSSSWLCQYKAASSITQFVSDFTFCAGALVVVYNKGLFGHCWKPNTSEIVGCAVCLTTHYTALQHAAIGDKKQKHVIQDTFSLPVSTKNSVNIYFVYWWTYFLCYNVHNSCKHQNITLSKCYRINLSHF